MKDCVYCVHKKWQLVEGVGKKSAYMQCLVFEKQVTVNNSGTIAESCNSFSADGNVEKSND